MKKVFDNAADSLEENYGLLSAIREISGMVPPPSSLDWSATSDTSLRDYSKEMNEDKSENNETEDISMINSAISSTPRDTFFIRAAKKSKDLFEPPDDMER